MSKEIKMRDVFNLPVKEQKIEVYGVDCKPSFTLEEIECYAASAINNHDRLVEENKRLRKVLKDVLCIVNDSTAVCGYHSNEDITDWDEFAEIRIAKQLLLELCDEPVSTTAGDSEQSE